MTMMLAGRPVGSEPVTGESGSEARAINRGSVESEFDKQIDKVQISRCCCSLRRRGIVQDLKNARGKGGRSGRRVRTFPTAVGEDSWKKRKTKI